MRAKEILTHQRKRPFTPIRIHVSDGASYDVRHPEMFTVTAHAVFIAQPPEEDGVLQGSVHCDPMHITRIQPINGQPSKQRKTKRN